jgi:hypothetical protein
VAGSVAARRIDHVRERLAALESHKVLGDAVGRARPELLGAGDAGQMRRDDDVRELASRISRSGSISASIAAWVLASSRCSITKRGDAASMRAR